MSIRPIITALGGITAVARELRHRNVTTVQGWWDRDIIPAHRQRSVLDLAKRLGKPITADQVIPPDRGASFPEATMLNPTEA